MEGVASGRSASRNRMAYSRCPGDGKGKCKARLAYSLKATGVRAPSRGIGLPVPEHKDAA
jgi:hypothetical protein